MDSHGILFGGVLRETAVSVRLDVATRAPRAIHTWHGTRIVYTSTLVYLNYLYVFVCLWGEGLEGFCMLGSRLTRC